MWSQAVTHRLDESCEAPTSSHASSPSPTLMARASMNPFHDVVLPSAKRRARSGSTGPAPSTHSTRSSLLPSVKIPYLRRLDSAEDGPTHNKTPILTLKCSSPSFLDSFVKDDLSKNPLYAIKTVGTSTTIIRADAWEGEVKTADIKWPKVVPVLGKGKDSTDGVLIQMRGARWKGGETLLKPGSSVNAPRKFNIPNYSQHMKWKQMKGGKYWCTTPSVKGPVAILEPAAGSLPPVIEVFETLHDKYDPRALHVHQGVSTILLDYLIVTALLLVTDIQEWMVVREFEGKNILIPNLTDSDAGPSSAEITATSSSQWRKVMFGEPIYPKLASGDNLPSASMSPQRSLVSMSPTQSSDPLPLTPTSAISDTMPRFVYRNSINSSFSNLQSSSLELSTSASSLGEQDGPLEEEEEPLDEEELEEVSEAASASRVQASRPSSPSAESIFYPLTPASAPSHTYLDPAFYNPNSVPPVPSLPIQYRKYNTQTRSETTRSRPTTPVSPTNSSFRPTRELPPAPSGPVPRPRSTPPRSVSAHGTDHRPQTSEGSRSIATVSPLRRPSDPGFNRSRASVSARPLPLPPPVPSPVVEMPEHMDSTARGLRHAQSSSGLPQVQPVTVQRRSSRPQRSLPPTPLALAHSHHNGVVPPLPSVGPNHLWRKRSEEDLTQWVHELTSPRGMAPLPIPDPVYDHPPPAYNSINFSNGEAPGVVVDLGPLQHSMPMASAETS